MRNPFLFLNVLATTAALAAVIGCGEKEAATSKPDANQALSLLAATTNMVLIPAGSFQMGEALEEGSASELPVHPVYVSVFYLDKYPVTKARWDEVFNWASTNGYRFHFQQGAQGKAANHPAQSITWYDAAKWCNARSEQEGRVPAYYTDASKTTVYRTGRVDLANSFVNWSAGYRLPTEAEWEKAARGGLNGRRFPWGDTISHHQANYRSYPSASGGFRYDQGPTGYTPVYRDGAYLYTSPVGSFAANGYGLYDMAGNVWTWCWDWYDASFYKVSTGPDPVGPNSGTTRAVRGGGWSDYAGFCRTANRDHFNPDRWSDCIGFRSVLPALPPKR